MATPQTRNLTLLPMNRAITTMAFPAIGWMLVEGMYHLVDAFWIGKLGADPFAAASTTSFLLWMLFAFADLPGVAVSSLVAQAVGAGESERVPELLRRGILLAVVLGVLLACLFYPFSEPLFLLLNLGPDVAALADIYLVPWLIGLPLLFVSRVFGHVFRGIGDAGTLMRLVSGALVVNTGLAPCLIFGLGPFPELGLAGAAWSTILCETAIVFTAMRVLHRRGLLPVFTGRAFFRLPLTALAAMMRIGLPIALNGVFFSLTYVGLTWIITHFGSHAVAAIGIGHRLESWPYWLSYGFGVAAATLVGQYLGAGQPARAQQAAWRCVAMAAVPVVVFVLAVLVWIEPIIRLFIDDPEVVVIGSLYLRIVAVSWLVGLLETVLQGAFSGAGHTLPPLVIGVPLTALRIPVAYLLAITWELGPLGIWLTIGLSMVLKGALLAAWFMTGTWKRPHRA